MEASEEGVMAKHLIEENTTVKVNTMIALLAEDGEDWKQVAQCGITDFSAALPPAATSTSEPAAAPPSGGSTPGTAVNMPSLSPTMEEGTIVKWHKAEGEAIAAGDVLCDIQTDKAVVSMEADDDGVVAKIIMEEGAGAKVGTLIALLVGEGEDWKDVAIPGSAPPPTAPAAAQSEAPAPVPATSGQPLTAPVQEFQFTHPAQTGPAAALLLSQYSINPADVSGSGPKGNLTKTDVLQYIKDKALPTPAPANVPLPKASGAPAAEPAKATSAAPPPPPRPTSGHTDVELTSMRRVIAKRLTESKQQAPHGYSSATSDITAISRLRQEYI